ncbi:MAG: flavodoxin family protein [Bacillota bacterium]|nr:flavodoxin family protein [Bacillota bacterium]
MKIVGIISSPHYEGSTALLVREALNGAKAGGAEVTEIYLPNRRLEYCKGCFTCMKLGKCPINDDFEEIKNMVYRADGIILSSPSYGMAPNAIMKNFLDRIGMFTVYTSGLGGKYAAGISTAGAIGAKKVARGLVGIVGNGAFQRGYVTGVLGVGVGWNEFDRKIKLKEEAYKLGGRMVSDIRSKRRYPLQNITGRVLNALVIRHFFIKNINRQKPQMEAVYKNLKSRNLIK